MLVLNIYFKDFLNLVLTDSLHMSLLKTLVVKGFDTTSEKFKQSNKRVCTDEERILFNLKIPFYIYMLLWQFCVQSFFPISQQSKFQKIAGKSFRSSSHCSPDISEVFE